MACAAPRARRSRASNKSLGFLTTEANAIVAPIHPKAMPVILTTAAEAYTWLEAESYALTDPVVIDALNAAEHRSVVVRIVLDPRERHDFIRLGDLSDDVRIKRGGPFMHLRAYEIDGTLLRTGSANFSTSGENAQDNDLIIIRELRPLRSSRRTLTACGTPQNR